MMISEILFFVMCVFTICALRGYYIAVKVLIVGE